MIIKMGEKRTIDDRKKLLIRYRINEKGYVSFIDPCCDEMPVRLLGKIMEAISDVEQEWNSKITNKVSSLPPDVTSDKPIIK